MSSLFEVLFGVALFSRKLEVLDAWGILILMILFLPVHIWDVFSNTHAIGNHNAALIRLPIQFLLIFIAWKLKTMFQNIKYKLQAYSLLQVQIIKQALETVLYIARLLKNNNGRILQQNANTI